MAFLKDGFQETRIRSIDEAVRVIQVFQNEIISMVQVHQDLLDRLILASVGKKVTTKLSDKSHEIPSEQCPLNRLDHSFSGGCRRNVDGLFFKSLQG
jgi:hypothetical protein